MNLAYNYTQAIESGFDVTPRKWAEDVGLTFTGTATKEYGRHIVAVVFFDCENVPSELPEFVIEVEDLPNWKG